MLQLQGLFKHAMLRVYPVLQCAFFDRIWDVEYSLQLHLTIAGLIGILCGQQSLKGTLFHFSALMGMCFRRLPNVKVCFSEIFQGFLAHTVTFG